MSERLLPKIRLFQPLFRVPLSSAAVENDVNATSRVKINNSPRHEQNATLSRRQSNKTNLNLELAIPDGARTDIKISNLDGVLSKNTCDRCEVQWKL